ncbi:MAG: hypothetical protein EA001_01860 [Oscillatoriales cyanobacterium]|nr:MAG: hypothetical protein EA001_01860 [Oscillatoriales cyanobacterium]
MSNSPNNLLNNLLNNPDGASLRRPDAPLSHRGFVVKGDREWLHLPDGVMPDGVMLDSTSQDPQMPRGQMA